MSIQPQHEMTIGRTIMSDNEYPRATPSKWNYTVPVIGVTAWTSAALTGIIYGFMKLHDYAHPSDQYNPKLYENAILALKTLGYIGAATIPASAGATLARATYNGCATVRHGICSASGRFYEVIKESVNPRQLGERGGIVVNTIAAVVAGPILAVWALASSGNSRSTW